MEGNFLSRYNNLIDEWSELIKKEPMNKKNMNLIWQNIS